MTILRSSKFDYNPNVNPHTCLAADLFFFFSGKPQELNWLNSFASCFFSSFEMNQFKQINNLTQQPINQISTVVTQTLQFKKWMPRANEDLQTRWIIQITLNRLPNWDFSLLTRAHFEFTQLSNKFPLQTQVFSLLSSFFTTAVHFLYSVRNLFFLKFLY